MTQKHPRRTIVLLTLLLAITAVSNWPACADVQLSQQPGRVDLSGVNGLLDLLDTLVGRGPTIESVATWARTVDERRTLDSIEVLAQRNEKDPRISAMIDSLLGSPAYQLYYAQYRNVVPAVHRRILCSLPYRAIDSPAGIADNLLELCRNRAEVREWAEDVVSKIDLARSDSLAREWVPEGQYVIPAIRLFYDGNGDAFAHGGQIGLDLFCTVLLRRPPATRFTTLAEINVDYIERTLAHELAHVYSAQVSRSSPSHSDTWQGKMINRITTGLISEGIAQQCNPPKGIKAELWNDTAIVAFWIKELGEKLATLKAGQGDRDEMNRWWSSTYHEIPESLLVSYLARRYPNADQPKLRWEHIADRPDLEHALGFWLVSRIYGNGNQKDRVLQLISEPDKLFPFYSESTKSAPESLRIRM